MIISLEDHKQEHHIHSIYSSVYVELKVNENELLLKKTDSTDDDLSYEQTDLNKLPPSVYLVYK